MLLLSHVRVDVLRLDLEKEAVRVCVDELAAFAVLLFQVVVVEVVSLESLKGRRCSFPHTYAG